MHADGPCGMIRAKAVLRTTGCAAQAAAAHGYSPAQQQVLRHVPTSARHGLLCVGKCAAHRAVVALEGLIHREVGRSARTL